jgi:ABC-type multidrug transport system ATPase subunit
MRVKVDVINSSLDEVLEKAGELQGKVNIQNKQIQGTIKENSTEINAFMKCAGYEYTVLIEESTNYNYRMILKPVGYDTEITSVKDHLSYGERNALALALFMFSAIKENPDLIILDDPISSFDGNKKFALLDMLFMSKKCIRDRTVLLLTHDFNTIIDTIYTLPRKFHPVPHGAFLSTKDGQLEEKQILKKDIQSYRKITVDNIAANIDSLNKLIYLRRFLEAEGNKGMAWQLLSNLFHKREIPEIHETESKSLTEQEQLATTEQANDKEPIPMTEPQQMEATTEIRKYVKDFDYSTELAKAQNNETLVNLYTKSTSNYEKLQLYRILHNENNENDVVRKFVNETFHAENDSLFQLNPREFDTIPQYIIDECDKEMIV